jgi:hypothetical protein
VSPHCAEQGCQIDGQQERVTCTLYERRTEDARLMRHPLRSANCTALIRLCSYGSHTPPHRSWPASASQNSPAFHMHIMRICLMASMCAVVSDEQDENVSNSPACSNCSRRS